MPLSFALIGQENIIKSITGKDEIKKHLANLGFVVGGKITVVNTVNGNLIVNVKDSRVAVDRNLANKIMI